MMTKKINNKGITLVEVIVVALLMSILAIGAFSIFMMYMNSLRETTARLRLQRQSEALLDQLAFKTRDGAFVTQTHDGAVTPGSDVSGGTFIVRDNADNAHGALYGFRIVAQQGTNPVVNVVQVSEDPVADSWTNFTIDGTPIEVDAAASFFELSGNRKQAKATLRLKTIVNGREYFLPVQGAVRCRN